MPGRAHRKAVPRRPVAPPRFLSAFGGDNRVSVPLVVLFALINSIVLVNAILHHPGIGYDSLDHLSYIHVLSEFRLPARAETGEFFSPPLPYLVPALADSTGAFGIRTIGKLGQMVNVLYSLGLTFYLLKLCEIVRPGDAPFKIVALGLLGMLPVYYKTFAFVRPEPLLAFLAVVTTYRAMRAFTLRRVEWRDGVALGVAFGLLILSRQQGFFLILGFVIFAAILATRRRSEWWPCARAMTLALAICAGVGGWFYLHLYREHGSMAAFNRPRPQFALANQPLDFYAGLGLSDVFRDPVRPAFRNQFLPKFYSEVWGDHESYFVVSGRDTRTGNLIAGTLLERALEGGSPPAWLETNRYEVNGYLGRVNLVSLLPSAVLLGGVLLGLSALVRFAAGKARGDERVMAWALLDALVVVSFGCYILLLVAHPTPSGSTIKATYMIQAFPLMAVLGSELLKRVRERAPLGFQVLAAGLALVALYACAAFVTRYHR